MVPATRNWRGKSGVIHHQLSQHWGIRNTRSHSSRLHCVPKHAHAFQDKTGVPCISLNKYPHFSLSNHKLLLCSLVCKWLFCYLKILKLPFICKRNAKLVCSVQTSGCLVICKLEAHTFRNTQPSLSHPVATAQQRMHTRNWCLFTHFNDFCKSQTSGQIKVMLNTWGNSLQFNCLQNTGGWAIQPYSLNWWTLRYHISSHSPDSIST